MDELALATILNRLANMRFENDTVISMALIFTDRRARLSIQDQSLP